MTVEDFRDYFRTLLASSGNPAIAGVDFYDVPGERSQKDLTVRGTDGTTLYLSIVRTSPPGGDEAGRDVVTKPEPGVQVIAGD
jgi:hypothetical protein